jgi:CheY-like chemotaxis protein
MMSSQLDSVNQVYLAGQPPHAAQTDMGLREADPALLKGRTVLVVEDEALVGMELQFELEHAGADVIGPIPTLTEAISAATEKTFAAAILDIDLRGQDVFPAADHLKTRDIPFLFHTGHGRRVELTEGYPGVPVCKKPMSTERLLRVLAGLLSS